MLVFDREDRLTDFVGQPAPYAALSGRAIAQMLAGQGIGLGLNLDVAPLVDPDPGRGGGLAGRDAGGGPGGGGRAARRDQGDRVACRKTCWPRWMPSWPRRRDWRGWPIWWRSPMRRRGPGICWPSSTRSRGPRRRWAQAVGEALIFSGIEAGELDVGFFEAGDPMTARLAKVGLRFDLPVLKARP